MAIIERKKNAIKGTISGLFFFFFYLVIPFIIRSTFIHFIGIEYAGLNSLFTSILQVLNLAELGVGSALVFSMYKPIAVDDTAKICALLKLYKTYYRIIGLVVLLIGFSITPFLKFLINGDVPSSLNLYVLYYLNLLTTVLSYWIFAYKSSILIAHQRQDLINYITFGTNVVKFSAQILIIILFKNYYFYLIISLMSQLCLNVFISLLVTKKYPSFRPEGNLTVEEKKGINKKVRDLFTSKVGSVILTSVDSIVISSFLGLRILAIYNNYFYIMNAIFALFMVLYNALRSGVANSFIVESSEKNIANFNVITAIIFFLMNICTACFLNLFQPFMILWIGPDFLFDDVTVYLLCVYFVSYTIPVYWSMYKDAAGVWKNDKYRPLVGSITNLALNILLVNIIGINGVLLSTIFSELVICLPWLFYILYRYIFKFDWKKIIIKMFFYLFVILLSSIISKRICLLFSSSGVLDLVLKLIISIIVPTLFYVALLWWTDDVKMCWSQIRSILSKILKRR